MNNECSIFFIEENKYDFDKFPEDLYVDTCFWNKAFKNRNKGYGYDFREFLKNAVQQGTTLYSSGIVKNEIMHITKNEIINNAVKKFHIKKPKFADGKVNTKELFKIVQAKDKSIIPMISDEIDFLIKNIDKLSEDLPFMYDCDFENEVQKLTCESGYIIGSIDAQHIVLAHRYGINSIATADGDYWCLDNANLYVPSSQKYSIERLNRKNTFLEFDENKY